MEFRDEVFLRISGEKGRLSRGFKEIKFHADLKGKETQIYNKSPLPPFKGESHLLAHLK
jgi:hypothetical protein